MASSNLWHYCQRVAQDEEWNEGLIINKCMGTIQRNATNCLGLNVFLFVNSKCDDVSTVL